MLLIKDCEINGQCSLDVRCADGLVREIGRDLQAAGGEKILDAGSGALLPGLHDHHIHLFSLAAARHSVFCGPPGVTDSQALEDALRSAGDDGWIRGIGYHESVAGLLDKTRLDEITPDRPVRIQHRSGRLWFLNSLGARLLKLDQHKRLDGIECDDSGEPTGALYRMDLWLREQLGVDGLPDIAATSKELAAYGVTGITEATPSNSSSTLATFVKLIEEGTLLQRVLLMGDDTLMPLKHPMLTTGPLKIILDDCSLPEFDRLKTQISMAHEQQRTIAIHCISRIELVFALSALKEVGSVRGDRIEHAAVTSPDTLTMLKETGVAVVTQPNFLAQRGDQYALDLDAQELNRLYRGRSFLDAGIPFAGSTDAPYGSPDPWAAMSAAVARKTRAGRVINPGECLRPEEALKLFTSSALNPGGGSREIKEGSPADFCLLACSWDQARHNLHHGNVVSTVCAGKEIWSRSIHSGPKEK